MDHFEMQTLLEKLKQNPELARALLEGEPQTPGKKLKEAGKEAAAGIFGLFAMVGSAIGYIFLGLFVVHLLERAGLDVGGWEDVVLIFLLFTTPIVASVVVSLLGIVDRPSGYLRTPGGFLRENIKEGVKEALREAMLKNQSGNAGRRKR